MILLAMFSFFCFFGIGQCEDQTPDPQPASEFKCQSNMTVYVGSDFNGCIPTSIMNKTDEYINSWQNIQFLVNGDVFCNWYQNYNFTSNKCVDFSEKPVYDLFERNTDLDECRKVLGTSVQARWIIDDCYQTKRIDRLEKRIDDLERAIQSATTVKEPNK